MSKTLGVLVNAALKSVGEAEITAFTSGEMLEEILIEEANSAVREVLAKCRYRWGLDRTTLTLTGAITTLYASVTNGSTTVTSVTSAGVNADNFTNVTADMFLKVGTDRVSYAIASIDTAASPDTLTLATAYQGTTDGDASVVFLQDTYDFTDTTIDEIILAQYGESRVYSLGYVGVVGDSLIQQVDLSTLHAMAGGWLHRNTSGKPVAFTEIAPDASDNRRLLFWPYPDDAYVIEMKGVRKYTENTTFATTMFGGDAPDVAYDVVEARMCRRACLFDNDTTGMNYWNGQYRDLMGDLISRENRANYGDGGMKVETYRARGPRGIRAVSQIAFDRSYLRR